MSTESDSLSVYPLAFALAIVETLAESDDMDTPEGVEQITLN
jgi:hypothetical protein